VTGKEEGETKGRELLQGKTDVTTRNGYKSDGRKGSMSQLAAMNGSPQRQEGSKKKKKKKE